MNAGYFNAVIRDKCSNLTANGEDLTGMIFVNQNLEKLPINFNSTLVRLKYTDLMGFQRASVSNEL